MRDLVSIGCMNSDTYKFPPHQHSIWEISYYTQGEGTLSIDSQEFSFQPGTIICQPPGMHIPNMQKMATGIYSFALQALTVLPILFKIYR